MSELTDSMIDRMSNIQNEMLDLVITRCMEFNLSPDALNLIMTKALLSVLANYLARFGNCHTVEQMDAEMTEMLQAISDAAHEQRDLYDQVIKDRQADAAVRMARKIIKPKK